MTKLYLVRHGETDGNINHIMQGQQIPGELTDKGIAQAEQLKERFSDIYFDAVLSSDLKRAFDTCHIIAGPHDLPVVTTTLLRERDWGELTGTTVPDPIDIEWPSTVETDEQIMKRAQLFIDNVKEQYPGKVVLGVSHEMMIRAIQAVYYKRQIKDIARMGNGEIRIIELK